MNGKSLFIGLLIFSLGLGIGFYGLRSAPRSGLDPSTKEKLQLLADSDLEDYYRLKTMEEKYLKADELLGKIMVIFLADLGLRVSASAQNAAKQPPIAASSSLSPSPSAPERLFPTPTPATPPPKPTEAHHKHWSSNEASLLELRDERNVPSLLRRLRVSDFESSLKSSRAFSNSNGIISSLNGGFEGSTRVRFGGAAHSWYVHIELAGAMAKGQLTGNLKIRMLENGKVFSNSSSSGNINAFRDFAGDSQALLAQASPTVFFQLYYLKELDQLAANVYRRESEQAGFEHIGSMSLKRSQ